MQTNPKGNEPPHRFTDICELGSLECAPSDSSEQVRRILARCCISALRLQELTRARYGEGAPYYIPNSFLSGIKNGVAPHICQLVALSRATDYRLSDWLLVFGIDLQQISRLQLKLHSNRTTWVMSSESLEPTRYPDPVAGWGNGMPPSCARGPRYLYSKIGRWDGMAFPEVMPGSIVRVDTTRKEVPGPEASGNVFLVEHVRGLSCCHVTRITRDEVLLTPTYLPYPCLRYRLGEQAIVHGTVDAELRPLRKVPIPEPAHPPWMERRYSPAAFCHVSGPAQLLRFSRDRLCLRYREAHAITKQIAADLGSSEYAVALGSLSDYEASNTLPRHLRKIMSLCIAYAMDLASYLTAAGIDLRDQGATPMPWLANANERQDSSPLSRSLISSSSLTGTPWPIPASLVQAYMQCMYPGDARRSIEYFADAQSRSDFPAALFVDRSSTTLEQATWPAAWQRPVYLVRHRGGHYLHGFCTITDGLLTVHPSAAPSSTVTSYPRGDVEVIGRVVAVVKHRKCN